MAEQSAEQSTTRRSFLGKLLGGTLLAGAAATVSAILAYLIPPKEVSSALNPQRVKMGRAVDLPPGKGKLTLVDGEPVWVVNAANGFSGLSALCTHKGCIVKWDEKRRLFSCPCHEGQFDEQGNVIFGLPRRPLSRFRVGLVRGELYVSRWTERNA